MMILGKVNINIYALSQTSGCPIPGEARQS